MTRPAASLSHAADGRRTWRRWITVGEVVGVGALIIAGLGYFDAHRERVGAQADRAAHARSESARAAFVLRASAEDSRLTLSPVDGAQVVQSQRYRFPRAVLDHAMEVSAATPQIDRDWLQPGLRESFRQRGGRRTWEGELPVGIDTRYVQDGEVRTDASLYRLGFRVEPGGLFSPPRVVLLGISLAQRRVTDDLQARVERDWPTT